MLNALAAIFAFIFYWGGVIVASFTLGLAAFAGGLSAIDIAILIVCFAVTIMGWAMRHVLE